MLAILLGYLPKHNRIRNFIMSVAARSITPTSEYALVKELTENYQQYDKLVLRLFSSLNSLPPVMSLDAISKVHNFKNSVDDFKENLKLKLLTYLRQGGSKEKLAIARFPEHPDYQKNFVKELDQLLKA